MHYSNRGGDGGGVTTNAFLSNILFSGVLTT